MKRGELVLFSLLLLILGAFLTALFLTTGCQSSATGTFRPIDPQTLTTITNAIVSTTRATAAFLPAPFGSVFEGVAAVAVGALALWQTITHRNTTTNTAAIKQLQNGNKL